MKMSGYCFGLNFIKKRWRKGCNQDVISIYMIYIDLLLLVKWNIYNNRIKIVKKNRKPWIFKGWWGKFRLNYDY